jgi:AcrR family transcriptional regulator
MSRNGSVDPPKIDRRIRRTRDRLGDALMALIQEKPLDSITVQDVLDRADVGRSTFYVHYRDKDDLLFSDFDEFLEAMATLLIRGGDQSDRVAPVRELFAHVADARRLYAALVASDRMHDFLDLGREHFARAIDRRLTGLPRSRGMATESRTATAYALAGALVSLMVWWIDHGSVASPAQMDDQFHQLVWAGVSATG